MAQTVLGVFAAVCRVARYSAAACFSLEVGAIAAAASETRAERPETSAAPSACRSAPPDDIAYSRILLPDGTWQHVMSANYLRVATDGKPS